MFFFFAKIVMKWESSEATEALAREVQQTVTHVYRLISAVEKNRIVQIAQWEILKTGTVQATVRFSVLLYCCRVQISGFGSKSVVLLYSTVLHLLIYGESVTLNCSFENHFSRRRVHKKGPQKRTTKISPS